MSLQRLGLSRLPLRPREVERAPAPPPAARERGVVVAHHGLATVRLDVNAGRLDRLDPATGEVRASIAIACAQDPLTPGLVALDARGQRALVMAARAAHGDPTLVLADFAAGTTDVVHAFEGPGWLVGGFCGRDDATLLVLEQRLGDDPRFRVLALKAAPRELLVLRGTQPACVPCGVGDALIALVLCPAPDPLTLTGPPSLCLLDIASRHLVALAPAEGTGVRTHGDALVVEGGRERVTVRLEGA